MASLDQFLNVIVDQGGSDLHIGEGQPPKMRKHGDVAPIREKPLTREETMPMLREVCGEGNWSGATSISPTKWTRLLDFAAIISSRRTVMAQCFD